jgi:rRNA maturation endonuclease Nob1
VILKLPPKPQQPSIDNVSDEILELLAREFKPADDDDIVASENQCVQELASSLNLHLLQQKSTEGIQHWWCIRLVPFVSLRIIH